MIEPIICFGQQPNGFFPKSFFVAKIETARKLQREIGGKIVWFCHDSDSDYRETGTKFIDRQSRKEITLNFTWKNKTQKKFSPLYAKEIAPGWQEETSRKLPQYIDEKEINLFKNVRSDTAAGFCIRMYQKLGLLDGIEIVRSSDPSVRRSAIPVTDFFMDTTYENEIVRARFRKDHLEMSAGGTETISLPLPPFDNEKISPSRDTRFAWMNSVINCTHYILGQGEKNYLKTEDFPNVKFILREEIEQSNLSWTKYE